MGLKLTVSPNQLHRSFAILIRTNTKSNHQRFDMFYIHLKSIINISLLLLLLFAANVRAQKKIIDTTVFNKWPELVAPNISPNGTYISYTIKNTPIGFNTHFVKCRFNKWQKSFITRDESDIALNDSIAMLKLGGDSLAIVNLGQSVEYLANYSSFKISKSSSNFIAAWSPDGLLLISNHRRITIKNVLEYFFVLNDSSILLQKSDSSRGKSIHMISLFNLLSMKETVLWSGDNSESFIFNKERNMLAFICNSGSSLVDNQIIMLDLIKRSQVAFKNDINKSLYIDRILAFNRKNTNIIVSLKELTTPKYIPNKLQLKIWSYKDQKIQTEQIKDLTSNQVFAAANFKLRKMAILSMDRDDWNIFRNPSEWGDTWLISQTRGDCTSREWWNETCKREWFIVDIAQGTRKRIPVFSETNRDYLLSPNEKYIVFYDYDKESYFSYCLTDNTLRDLTNNGINIFFRKNQSDTTHYLSSGQRGVAGWGEDGKSVYIYDSNDIWRFDLTGKEFPLNLTNGFGNKNGIIFSLLEGKDANIKSSKEELTLSCFDTNSKDNGFAKTRFVEKLRDPQILSSGHFLYYLPFHPVASYRGMQPLKAENVNLFIVRRESSREFPNFFTTSDFKNFERVTDLKPETSFNWVTTELHTWKLPDGKMVQGILYKPENFDSTKKYPIIFQIYEKLSNALNAYVEPAPLCAGCTINPTFMASNDYLVFKPDIYYKLDKSGESALVTVESAVKYLSNFSWIDTSRMGLQGCSFGGYETNFIITHSKLFKAACTASGVSDLFSYYSGEYENTYTAFSYGQYRMSADIWDNPQAFVSSSPLFKVKDIVTPLLLFHTSKDDAVDFTQGIQLFLIMRRLKKKVWLLEYGRGNHGVFRPDDAKDFGIRMFQFFNYYLKGQPIPKWMHNGINAKDTTDDLGLQLITSK
ncbi:S9 family peptidase [Chitinophaga polysaccharea]|uniref:alpha/beta hydrolase family protein n=1 Tax=Chitinophaga polysaccharea TaxID=1293035 RepID=UPI0014556796|nr:prolyl oligopeptidase family serine peptidase [Chitinophaga polysaccharea]NLR60708.1 S9 family peptidase [Chitinophaga polysaccharea]